jgi:putative serine protease PepD
MDDLTNPVPAPAPGPTSDPAFPPAVTPPYTPAGAPPAPLATWDSSIHERTWPDLAFTAPVAPATPAVAVRPRARSTVVLVLIGSLIAATLASVGTAAFVLGTRPGAAPLDAAATSPGPSATQSATLTGLDATTAIVSVAKEASPAVVTITTTSTGSGRFGGASEGIGSGFLYDAGGWILTNNHVIESDGTLTVTLNDGREFPGRVAAADPAHDLAVVKIDGTGFPTLPIGSSSNLQVGQLVIAIGSPLGQFTDSVTSGILSATGRSITVSDQATRQRRTLSGLLQTDAAINEGNSGGPLLDGRGQVIGINSATASTAQGIGFAIPIDAAASIMASALTH